MRRCLLPLLFLGLFVSTACETPPHTSQNTQQAPSTNFPTQPSQPVSTPVRPVIQEPIVDTGPQIVHDESLPETIRVTEKGSPVIRAALILPLDHKNPRIRAESEGILNGIEMAIFDNAEDNFVLLPLPTDGSSTVTRQKFQEAAGKKADIILGPLMSRNTVDASGNSARSGVPVLAFSNDAHAARSGANLVSLITEEEVRHMVEYAVQQGVTGFGFFGPDTAYGRRVEAAMRAQVALAGRSYVANEFYNAQTDIPSDAAERFVSATKDYATASPRQFAVLIPDAGIKLRSVATLLPYFGLNERNTVFMGTRVWNDPSVWREPVLTGGVFPLADPANVDAWSSAFSRLFGKAPSRLASYGYDAGQLAIMMFSKGELDRTALLSQRGISGVNGVYRFRPDRTAERNLAVMRITADGMTEMVSEADLDFPGQF